MIPDNTATAWAHKLMTRGTHPQTIAAWMRLELDRDPRAFDPKPRWLPFNGPDDLDAIVADATVPDGVKLFAALLAHDLRWCSCYRQVTDDDEAWLRSHDRRAS